MKGHLKSALFFIPIGVFAVGLITEVLLCFDCRDPKAFPEDYGNYLYNQSFGVDGDAERAAYLRQGGIVEVKQYGGASAIVGIKYIVEDYKIPFPFLPFLSSFTITTASPSLMITVQKPDSKQHEYKVFANSGKLPVGGPKPTVLQSNVANSFGATIDWSGILTYGDNGTANRGGVLLANPSSYFGGSDFSGFGSDAFGISSAMDALFGEPLASVWSEGNAFANLNDDWLDEMVMATAKEYAATNYM